MGACVPGLSGHAAAVGPAVAAAGRIRLVVRRGSVWGTGRGSRLAAPWGPRPLLQLDVRMSCGVCFFLLSRTKVWPVARVGEGRVGPEHGGVCLRAHGLLGFWVRPGPAPYCFGLHKTLAHEVSTWPPAGHGRGLSRQTSGESSPWLWSWQAQESQKERNLCLWVGVAAGAWAQCSGLAPGAGAVLGDAGRPALLPGSRLLPLK